MHKCMSTGLAIAILATTRMAQAQGAPEFGAQGQLAISAERLFGVYYVHAGYHPPAPNPDSYMSATAIGFGWNMDPDASSFTQSRAGVDYFVIDRLSLGAALGLYAVGGHDHPPQDTGFLLAPRVGYAVDLGRVASFWPRGGITYYSHGDYHNFGLTGEGNFALFPRPNWAFLITPFFDAGPFGGVGNTDYTEITLGVTFGIVGVI